MRVATRRARAFLRAARPLRRPGVGGRVARRARVAGLGARVGPRSRRARRTDPGSDRPTGRRRNCGTRLRRRSRATAEKGASLRRRGAVGGALSRAARSARRAEPAAGLQPERASTLAELWWAEFVRTRRRFEKLDRESSDDELHAARIRVKRTRYAAELAANELGVPGERFVDAAKVLQDVLGEHQDALVAEEHIRAWSEGKPDADDAVRKLLKRERAASEEGACRVASKPGSSSSAARERRARDPRGGWCGHACPERRASRCSWFTGRRYGDWSLPKGKALEGERDEACAQSARSRRRPGFAVSSATSSPRLATTMSVAARSACATG